MAIERKFVAQNVKEFEIHEFIMNSIKGVGYSHLKLTKTPLGDKIIIYASRPGLVVGRGGANITKLTKDLKEKFNLENPQIEITEVENVNLDANIVAERIVNTLERFGTSRFKGIGHKTMEDVINAGALGVEILISGRLPSSRAKTWRFYKGYLKKCGDLAVTGVLKSIKAALIKAGSIGVQVSILPPYVKLPDNIQISQTLVEEESETETPEEVEEEIKKAEEGGAEEKETRKEEAEKTQKKSKKSTGETKEEEQPEQAKEESEEKSKKSTEEKPESESEDKEDKK